MTKKNAISFGNIGISFNISCGEIHSELKKRDFKKIYRIDRKIPWKSHEKKPNQRSKNTFCFLFLKNCWTEIKICSVPLFTRVFLYYLTLERFVGVKRGLVNFMKTTSFIWSSDVIRVNDSECDLQIRIHTYTRAKTKTKWASKRNENLLKLKC